MKYGSVCSGIEAASVAWHPLGWEAQWFSEIENFPSAVLAHRFPNVPNLGDMTKLHENDTFKQSTIDVLVGGTPCQSFSVAGLRKGLDDPRGNLMLTFLNLAGRKRPTWVVWENVPGVLSSNEGRDFGTFLSGLAELGYGFAYRVLDAQYFGVAQRRRRVFVVGYLGDWRPAAAVLFERHSLSGHPAPRREAGESVAGGTNGSVEDGIPEVSNALCARDYKGPRPEADQGAPIVSHAFKVRGGCEGGGKGYLGQDEAAFTISAGQDQVVFEYKNETIGALCARDFKGVGNQYVDEGKCIVEKQLYCVAEEREPEPCPGITVLSPARRLKAVEQTAIRRLTPVECERLQGFPDNWTKIPYRNKLADQCPDGPRYKACGNSMAVPVMRWIGKRIQMVNDIL